MECELQQEVRFMLLCINTFYKKYPLFLLNFTGSSLIFFTYIVISTMKE